MLFGFGFLVVLAYSALVAFHPEARRWATSATGPTPFKIVNQILALPAELIGGPSRTVATYDARAGVQDRIAANAKGSAREAGNAATDPFGPTVATPGTSSARAGAEAGDKENGDQAPREGVPALSASDAGDVPAIQSAPVHPVAAEGPPAAGPAELKLPGGVVVTNRSPEGVPPASESFMYWTASLTVSAVLNTSPARFLMNGRLVREGDEASRPLGITFDRVDSAARLIYFRDKSGAVVTRSY